MWHDVNVLNLTLDLPIIINSQILILDPTNVEGDAGSLNPGMEWSSTGQQQHLKQQGGSQASLAPRSVHYL